MRAKERRNISTELPPLPVSNGPKEKSAGWVCALLEENPLRLSLLTYKGETLLGFPVQDGIRLPFVYTSSKSTSCPHIQVLRSELLSTLLLEGSKPAASQEG